MPNKDIQHLHISTWTLVRFFLIIFVVLALYVVRDIVFSLIFAIIIASAMEPAILWLKERKIPRILSVVVLYLVIAFAFFFAVYLVFPLLFDEIRSLSSSYSIIHDRFLSGIEQVGVLPLLSPLSQNFGDVFSVPSEYLGKLSGGIYDFAATVFGGVWSFILIVVFSFYLATQERGIENFLRLVVPLRYEPYLVDLWQRSQRKLGRWFRAQLLLGAIVGILIFFGLTILGVPNALFFAFLAGVFEIIPIVGPILAAVPAVGVALLTQPLLGAFTVALYIVVQQMESHVIVPVVMRKTIGLSPLIVVLALLVGVKIGGIFGILLSVPITAILAEFLSDWDKKKRALMPE